jgi:peptidoglycan hydrolase-like protein with peptidoglycan-binding domain
VVREVPVKVSALRNPRRDRSHGRALNAEAVRTIQGRLKQIGLYSDGVDGIWGDSKQAALERFQRNRGLQVSSRRDPIL